MVRTRNYGNFLWYIFNDARQSKQVELKERLIAEGGKSLWDNFWRRQTSTDKKTDFNAFVVGEMVKIFVDNKLIQKFELSDIEKLKAHYEIRIQLNNQTILPIFKNEKNIIHNKTVQ